MLPYKFKKKKKGMSQSSEIAVITDGELVSPEETWDVKTESLPQTAEIHTKGMISVSPDLCIFPHIKKC